MAENGTVTVSNNPEGSIFNRAFLAGAGERAVKTGAQAAVVFLGASFVAGDQLNALTVDWVTLAGFFLGGVIVSFLTSVANPQFVAGAHEVVRVPDLVPPLSSYEPKHLAEPAGSTVVGGVS